MNIAGLCMCICIFYCNMQYVRRTFSIFGYRSNSWKLFFTCLNFKKIRYNTIRYLIRYYMMRYFNNNLFRTIYSPKNKSTYIPVRIGISIFFAIALVLALSPLPFVSVYEVARMQPLDYFEAFPTRSGTWPRFPSRFAPNELHFGSFS